MLAEGISDCRGSVGKDKNKGTYIDGRWTVVSNMNFVHGRRENVVSLDNIASYQCHRNGTLILPSLSPPPLFAFLSSILQPQISHPRLLQPLLPNLAHNTNSLLPLIPVLNDITVKPASCARAHTLHMSPF